MNVSAAPAGTGRSKNKMILQQEKERASLKQKLDREYEVICAQRKKALLLIVQTYKNKKGNLIKQNKKEKTLGRSIRKIK